MLTFLEEDLEALEALLSLDDEIIMASMGENLFENSLLVKIRAFQKERNF
jgi:hypothetical protein